MTCCAAVLWPRRIAKIDDLGFSEGYRAGGGSVRGNPASAAEP